MRGRAGKSRLAACEAAALTPLSLGRFSTSPEQVREVTGQQEVIDGLLRGRVEVDYETGKIGHASRKRLTNLANQTGTWALTAMSDQLRAAQAAADPAVLHLDVQLLQDMGEPKQTAKPRPLCHPLSALRALHLMHAIELLLHPVDHDDDERGLDRVAGEIRFPNMVLKLLARCQRSAELATAHVHTAVFAGCV